MLYRNLPIWLNELGDRVERRLKEGGKAFLREVVIVREHFGEIPFAHRYHGYAIGEAIAFVGARFVEVQPGKKVLVSLGHYFGMELVRSSSTTATALSRASFPCSAKKFSTSTKMESVVISSALWSKDVAASAGARHSSFGWIKATQ
jgi:hypothetical protein